MNGQRECIYLYIGVGFMLVLVVVVDDVVGFGAFWLVYRVFASRCMGEELRLIR